VRLASVLFTAVFGDIELLATFNPVTDGIDAVRAIVLGKDVLTVLSVGGFGGVWNTLVPALGVLAGLNVVFGAIAVTLMARASSASVA
jgi:ABC-2 type transport system permease protein